MPPALCPSLLSLPLGRLLLCRALDQCADPTASPHYLFFLPSVLCMCQPFNCPHTSLLEKTLVTDLNISDCAFCVMHVVAIPDHRTQISFAQSILPYRFKFQSSFLIDSRADKMKPIGHSEHLEGLFPIHHPDKL